MIHINYPQEYEVYEEEWELDGYGEPIDRNGKLPVELALIFLVFVVMLTLGKAALGLDIQIVEPIVVQPVVELDTSQPANDIPLVNDTGFEEPIAVPLPEATAIIAPYDDFIVTQGAHGLSYGHLAIDIAAGKGAPIRSPISGVVSEQYVDMVGNPTIVIENQQYKVTLLHGIYTPMLGDSIQIGQLIGSESNIGNTRDMQGNSCRGRDCGYHTHLNIFDKIAGTNVDPLSVISN